MKQGENEQGWSAVWTRLRFAPNDPVMWGGAAVVLVAAAILFSTTTPEVAKRWDIQWGFHQIQAMGWLLAIGLLANGKRLWLSLRSEVPSRNSLLALLVLLVGVGWFAQTNVGLQHRVLSDESSWESMALQMMHSSSGGVCNQGWFDETGKLTCTEEVNNFKGKAWAWVQYLAFHFGPDTRDTSLRLNLPLLLGGLGLFFLFLFRLLKEEWTALAGTAFLAAFPIMLFQAQAASTEVLYVFLLSAIALTCILIPPDKADWKQMVFLIPLIGIFAQTRQETIFCLLPVAFYYLPFFRQRPWHMAAFALLVLVASWPAINTMIAYKGYDFQGGTHSAHSVENLLFNVKSNLRIMWNPETDVRGLLRNPFFTTQTAILLASALFLIVQGLRGRRSWGMILFLLFHLQTLVILVNVSGTFEIDINQRYVLVALPSFALVMAMGLRAFVGALATGQSSSFAQRGTALTAIAISSTLLLVHVPDFRANIMYERNKLLAEELFLNAELHKLPKGSIFIYARPWQMLCQGLNAYSENTFLNWTEQEMALQMQRSESNIYVVRGQDGYGGVDRNSRVVGFKTTDQLERILTEYETNRVIFNSKDFGYPLTVHQILSRKGASKWANSITLLESAQILQRTDTLVLSLQKSLVDTLAVQVIGLPGVAITTSAVSQTTTIQIPATRLPAGLVRSGLAVTMPDGTLDTLTRDIFVNDEAQLLQSLVPTAKSQDWGEANSGKSVEQHKFRIDDHQFDFGWGTHANSRLTFSLGGKWQTLRSYIGVDDESACGDGAVFVVIGDGRPLFRSPILTSHVLDSVTVSVAGVQTLELVTEMGLDNMCDHTNWANAWLSAAPLSR